MVWHGMAWHGMAWCGVVWCGVVWFGMVWSGVVWYRVVCFGLVWYDMLRFVMVWFRCVGFVLFCFVLFSCLRCTSTYAVKSFPLEVPFRWVALAALYFFVLVAFVHVHALALIGPNRCGRYSCHCCIMVLKPYVIHADRSGNETCDFLNIFLR